jgi:ribonucleotide reductase class II
VFYRTYSRKDATDDGERETWAQVCDRTLGGLVELGQLTEAERELIARMQQQVKALPFGPLAMGGGHRLEQAPRKLLGGLQLHQHQRGGLAGLWADDGSGHDGLRHRGGA